jgi:hypothetical protein
MGTINSSDRIAATLYFLETWFVSGMRMYKYPTKGDNDIIVIVIIIIIIIIIIILKYM